MNDFDKKLLNHIKRNSDKSGLFYGAVTHVSKSGMSRNIKLYIVYKGGIVRVTHIVAQALGRKLNRDLSLTVKGCGMDMVFDTINNFGVALYGYPKGFNKAAFQHYKGL